MLKVSKCVLSIGADRRSMVAMTCYEDHTRLVALGELKAYLRAGIAALEVR